MDKPIRKTKDNSIKVVLDNPDMFVSLLRNFVPVELLKDVEAEDIEDVTARFLSMVSEQKEGDTIKRVNLKGSSHLFVIAIVEAESKVNFRAPFKMLLYIALILDAYEKEVIEAAAKSNSGRKQNPVMRKGFKYPPVLPIIFYDGAAEWTASTNFLHRTQMHEAFEKYIPKFEYELVDLNKYSTDDLAKYGDLLSLFLILDKVRAPEDMKSVLSTLKADYAGYLEMDVPEHLRKLLADITRVLLAKVDAPQDEIEEVADKIYKKGVPELCSRTTQAFPPTRNSTPSSRQPKSS